MAVDYALTKEKCLSAFKIQQLLEAQSIKLQVKECRTKAISILNAKFASCWGPQLSEFERMAFAEEVFHCLNLLDSLAVFREQLSENLLRQIAKATVGKETLSEMVASLKELLEGSLSWLMELVDLTNEGELRNEVRECLTDILLKGIFSKAEYFPVSNLEVYTENFQNYHEFCLDIYGRWGLPLAIKTHLKKKESLLYKSFVITVIKKLEGSLIQLAKHIETCKSGSEIEEYCHKKSGRSLKAVIRDLIERNISKDTITSTLLHRVFAIGLRTILRIQDFFQTFYQSLSETSVLEHLARVNVDLCESLTERIDQNIDEIQLKLGIEEKQVSEVKAAFLKRVRGLRDTGICFSFDLDSRGVLRLEDEVAGIALKLNMQMEEPKHESSIVNNVQNSLTKFLDKGLFPSIDGQEQTAAVVRHLLELVESHFDKQIEDSITTMEINKKFSAAATSGEPRLNELIEKQKWLDLAALRDIAEAPTSSC